MDAEDIKRLEAEAHDYRHRLAVAVYLHYRNRTDLDPVQQKHLELATEAINRTRALREARAESAGD